MFSVIVPVYNVEDYLAKCLDSIIPALQADDELILAIGKSSDSSTSICHQYAEKEPVVREIFQSGTGLSNARNCAVRAAAGDYIFCVDSDDFVETQAFKALLDRIRRERWTEDVIVTDFYRYDRRTGATTPFFQIGDVPDRTDWAFLPEMLRKRQCFWNVWRYGYRRAFLLEHQIRYLENKLSEDIAYTTDVLLCAETVRFTHSPYYVYTVGRGDSLMDRPTWKRLSDTVELLTGSIRRVRQEADGEKGCIARQYQFEFLLDLAQIWEIEPEKRNEAAALFRAGKGCLRPSQDPVVRTLSAALDILGVRITAGALYCLKHLRRFLRKRKRRYGL